jgi:hypothetical protein
MKFSGVGLLATTTPSLDAAARSILSVPIKGTMTSRRSGAASRTPRLMVSRCEARMTSTPRAASISSASV